MAEHVMLVFTQHTHTHTQAVVVFVRLIRLVANHVEVTHSVDQPCWWP